MCTSFHSEQLETLEVVGMSVTKVRFFPRGAGTYKVQVWTGGSATDPGTLAHEQFAQMLHFYNGTKLSLQHL